MAFRVLALGLWPPPMASSIVSCCQSLSPFPEKPAQAWVLKEGRLTTSSFSEESGHCAFQSGGVLAARTEPEKGPKPVCKVGTLLERFLAY